MPNAGTNRYGQKFSFLGLARVKSGQTGKSGGRAQAVWCSEEEVLVEKQVSVHAVFKTLSDHHLPISVEAKLRADVEETLTQSSSARMAMRKVKRGEESRLAIMMQEVQHQWEFEQVIMLCMALPPPTTVRALFERAGGRVFKARKKLISAKLREVAKNYEFKIKKAAKTNSPWLNRIVQSDIRKPDLFEDFTNGDFARVLQDNIWKMADLDPASVLDYLRKLNEIYEVESVLRELNCPFTTEEIAYSRGKLGHAKVYADFEAKVAHLMDERALEKVCDWYFNVGKDYKVVNLYTIPTNKPHAESTVPKILLKERRAIGIQPLFDAWKAATEAIRLQTVFGGNAPRNMHGNLPGRQNHGMLKYLARSGSSDQDGQTFVRHSRGYCEML